jgi:hypothetical protein
MNEFDRFNAALAVLKREFEAASLDRKSYFRRFIDLITEAVSSGTDAFFAAHPDEPRTAQSERIIMAMIFERLVKSPGQN